MMRMIRLLSVILIQKTTSLLESKLNQPPLRNQPPQSYRRLLNLPLNLRLPSGQRLLIPIWTIWRIVTAVRIINLKRLPQLRKRRWIPILIQKTISSPRRRLLLPTRRRTLLTWTQTLKNLFQRKRRLSRSRLLPPSQRPPPSQRLPPRKRRRLSIQIQILMSSRKRSRRRRDQTRKVTDQIWNSIPRISDLLGTGQEVPSRQ